MIIEDHGDVVAGSARSYGRDCGSSASMARSPSTTYLWSFATMTNSKTSRAEPVPA